LSRLLNRIQHVAPLEFYFFPSEIVLASNVEALAFLLLLGERVSEHALGRRRETASTHPHNIIRQCNECGTHLLARGTDLSGRKEEAKDASAQLDREGPTNLADGVCGYVRSAITSFGIEKQWQREHLQVQSIESPGAVKLTSHTLPTSKLLPWTARRALAAQTTPSKWFSSSGDEREQE
jgi:hypothetical protein